MIRSKEMAVARRHACVEDLDLIWKVLTLTNPPLTVILGAGSGTMSTAWLEWRHGQDAGELISVDNSQDALATEATAWYGADFDNAILHGVGQAHMDSVRAAVGLDTIADFLIVDADHSYEGVHGDLVAWMPHVPVGGAIMLHDYDAKHAPEFYPGVKQAADELLLPPTWDLIEKAGWSAAWRRAS